LAQVLLGSSHRSFVCVASLVLPMTEQIAWWSKLQEVGPPLNHRFNRDNFLEFFQALEGTLQDADAILSKLHKDSEGLVSLDMFINWVNSNGALAEKLDEAELPEAKPLQETAALRQLVQERDTALNARIEQMGMELSYLRQHIQSKPVHFSVGQYNILAGYMGKNKEPWFLYGVDVNCDRRKAVMMLYEARNEQGEFIYGSWPLYVQGILSSEEQAAVERYDKDYFDWELRKDRLLDVIRNMNADIVSLVECDHYADHFQPGLAKLGYQSTWKQRPRRSSQDGCCIAWRTGLFELLAQDSIDFVDGFDSKRQVEIRDRVALMALLRFRLSGEVLCFVSTHLARNPEQVERDRLRGRQVAQLMHALADFTRTNHASDAPVVLVGDMNATSFGRLKGISNAIDLLSDDASAHPFTFDCADVPTGATSVTACRNVRIDAIMYQSSRLELADVGETPPLNTSDPIPNNLHPSDHVPIFAKFLVRSRLQMAYAALREWYCQVVGEGSSLILDALELNQAFKLLDHDGTGSITEMKLMHSLSFVFGTGTVNKEKITKVVSKFSSEGMCFSAFVQMYGDAIAAAGLPCRQDFKDAFAAFDREHTGTLSLQDVLAVFADCSTAKVPADRIAALFAVVDKHKSGLIDLEEFLEHLAYVWHSHFATSFPKQSHDIVKAMQPQV